MTFLRRDGYVVVDTHVLVAAVQQDSVGGAGAFRYHEAELVDSLRLVNRIEEVCARAALSPTQCNKTEDQGELLQRLSQAKRAFQQPVV